jgi:hypothetical protein
MLRSRELERHAARVRYESPIEPTPRLRPWAFWLLLAVVAFAMVCTVKGW